MSPEEIEAWLVDQIEQVIDETVDETAKELISLARQQIPLTRRKTRQAVKYQSRSRATGYRVTIRLGFQDQYPSQGTVTERVWNQMWRRVRYRFTEQFNRQLNSRLKRI